MVLTKAIFLHLYHCEVISNTAQPTVKRHILVNLHSNSDLLNYIFNLHANFHVKMHRHSQGGAQGVQAPPEAQSLTISKCSVKLNTKNMCPV